MEIRRIIISLGISLMLTPVALSVNVAYEIKGCPCDPVYCRVHKFSYKDEVCLRLCVFLFHDKLDLEVDNFTP